MNSAAQSCFGCRRDSADRNTFEFSCSKSSNTGHAGIQINSQVTFDMKWCYIRSSSV